MTPSGTVTLTLTSAPKPFTGSIKIGVGTTHSAPCGRTIHGSKVRISKSGSLSTVNGIVTERSAPPLEEPVTVSRYSPLVRFIVSTITVPAPSMVSWSSSNIMGAFSAFKLALMLTDALNSLNPTTFTHAANGKPILATSSGTLGSRVKSGVAQSLLPCRPAKTWIPLAVTESLPTVKSFVERCR